MSSEEKGTFLWAAQQILAEAKEPLHYREITRRALASSLVATRGLTPEATLYAQITTNLKRNGRESPFVRIAPGVIGLREWVQAGDLKEPDQAGGRIYVPHFPIYSETRALLPAWVGLQPAAITSMQSEIGELRGNPQQTVDWSEPERWIPERLDGEAREVALRTWEKSGRKLNPRYTTGHWSLINHYRLMAAEGSDSLQISDRGQRFISEPKGDVVKEIDLSQGLQKLLELLAELGTATRSDLIDPWREHLLAESRVRSDTVVKSFLWARLRNLVDRGLVERTGHSYSLTQAGLDYLQDLGALTPAGKPDLPQQIRQLLDEQRRRVREELRDLIAEMDPYAFENLIKRLLDEMGYEDVEVTPASRDRGIDVVGNIELGITSVREVIQVKRHRGNIQRPVLDALRGVLHRWGAVRGTIITSGDFSRGTRDAAFETGAAPVTLIDGNKLVDLLIQYELGIQKKKVELWELDTGTLLGGIDEEEEIEAE